MYFRKKRIQFGSIIALQPAESPSSFLHVAAQGVLTICTDNQPYGEWLLNVAHICAKYIFHALLFSVQCLLDLLNSVPIPK